MEIEYNQNSEDLNLRIITLTNKDVSVPGASSELLDRCSIRGVKVKYNSEARKKTEEVLLNFLTKNQFN